MSYLKQSLESAFLFYLPTSSVLDNFAATSIFYRGNYWPTAEHAYQASKFVDPAIVARIREAVSPYSAKDLAHESCHTPSIRPNWRGIKVREMYEIVTAKAAQHKVVKEVLLSTGNALLIEDSSVDDFWGRGSEWNGLNMAGRIWMAIRGMYQGNSHGTSVEHLEALAEAWYQGVRPKDDGNTCFFGD